jgi:hypothetical protein
LPDIVQGWTDANYGKIVYGLINVNKWRTECLRAVKAATPDHFSPVNIDHLGLGLIK